MSTNHDPSDAAPGRSASSGAAQYRPALVRYAYSYLNDAAQAEDVVQEVFTKLARPEGQPAGALRPWLYKLTRNRCLDVLRRRQVSPTHDRPLKSGFDAPRVSAGPLTRVAQRERREVIRRVIADMPEEYRDVLLLKHAEGLSRAEIGEILGVSDATVKGRLVRATQYLEKELLQIGWTLA